MKEKVSDFRQNGHSECYVRIDGFKHKSGRTRVSGAVALDWPAVGSMGGGRYEL